MSLLDHLLAALAAVAAGAVNAIAGGGTLISFPVLVAIGVPAVSANVTNTVALCPGYLGGSWAQRELISAQRTRVRLLVPAAVLGGLAGSILLVNTSDDAFRTLIPILVGGATILLATQNKIRAALGIGAPGDDHPDADRPWLWMPIAAVSVYGGYFGAGLGIMLLAVLGIALHDRLDRLNALKQVLSLVINVTAAGFFVFSGKVEWSLAAVMAVGSLLGGNAGGRLAGTIPPARLRTLVAVVGTVVSVVYAIRIWF